MTVDTVNTALFRQAVESMPNDSLSEIRRTAAASFALSGFPTQRDEDWKYTNLRRVVNLTNQWLNNFSENDSRNVAGTDSVLDSVDAWWIPVRNGRAEIDSGQLPDGVSVCALSASKPTGRLVEQDALAQFNSALLTDGITVSVAKGSKLDKPLGFLFSDSAGDEPAVTQYRVDIEMEDGASAMIIEAHRSSGDGDHFANGVIQIAVRPGAMVDYVRIQERARHHLQTGKTFVSVARDGSFRHCAFDLGGSLIRNDVDVELCGSAAYVGLHGLYLAGDGQHIDNHTKVHHRVGPTKSDEEYRGILNRKSRCVFNGKAIVHKGADGTDAQQSNHNLLLSGDAEIDTKPELEIYADDVKCSHGATVGELDAAALFYLRTRGIELDAAKHLLTRAFASDVLGMMTVPAMLEYVNAAVDARLDTLVGVDGV